MPYPIALNLRGKQCLVVGGGAVACRKLEGLLEAGGIVTVVAPDISVSLIERAAGRATLLTRPFEPGDVSGMRLVFACTDSPEVNARVAEAAEDAGVLCSRADDPAGGDFASMSTILRGNLLIAISTGTESPAFARWLRRRLEKQFGPEYGEFLELAASLRQEVKERLPAPERGPAWERALDSGAFDLVREGRPDAALQCLRRFLFGDESARST